MTSMTPAAAFALIAAHRITVGAHGRHVRGWYASCIVPRESECTTFDYFESHADTPLAAVEALAVERGWIAEAQRDLFETVPERKEA